MIRALAFVLTVLAGPAHALSCAPYGPTDAFLAAAESPDRYVVVHGTVDFNPALMPQGERGSVEASFRATLTGFSLTQDGFSARFVRTITVRVSCVGPYCGALVPGSDVLGFLKKDESGYLLDVSPCGGFAFVGPDATAIETIEACFRGEACDPLGQR